MLYCTAIAVMLAIMEYSGEDQLYLAEIGRVEGCEWLRFVVSSGRLVKSRVRGDCE